MNQYFNDDKLLIFDEGETNRNIKTLFSRTEDYSLYKGLNRTYKIDDDYTDDYNCWMPLRFIGKEFLFIVFQFLLL